jgi:hypothetical protein
MGIDPIDSIALGSKFPEMVHGPIRPYYLHAPNLAVLHWRQQSASMIRSGRADKPMRQLKSAELTNWV